MPDQHRRSAWTHWLVPAVVVLVAAVLIIVILVPGKQEEAPEEGGLATEGTGVEAPTEIQGPEEPDLSEAERRDEDDLLAVGPVDAPVVLVVFSDYQCPFCAQWSEETLPLLMERVEAGELRIEFRDVNVFGPDSERAARAAYAAAEQDSFQEYHDALFAGGEHRSAEELTDESLVELAGELGLDTDQFATDMNSEETTAQVAENEKLGLDLGAYTTPAFVLGGQPIVGAQPSQVFLDAFDEALAEAEK